MQAMVAYIDFLSTGVPPGEKLPGLGAGKCLSWTVRPTPSGGAPPMQGLVPCATRRTARESAGAALQTLGYMVPPLWGEDSFNDGAGMNRLITAANFIHYNMPNGTEYDHPFLLARMPGTWQRYVVAQPRPHKAGLERDFPDLSTSLSTRPMGRMQIGSANSSISLARSGPSAQNWNAFGSGDDRTRAQSPDEMRVKTTVQP